MSAKSSHAKGSRGRTAATQNPSSRQKKGIFTKKIRLNRSPRLGSQCDLHRPFWLRFSPFAGADYQLQRVTGARPGESFAIDGDPGYASTLDGYQLVAIAGTRGQRFRCQ